MLFRMVGIELHRALVNRAFLIALFVTSVFIVGHMATCVIPYGVDPGWESWRLGKDDIYPISFFQTWIGMTGYNGFTAFLFILAPLTACIPYSLSYATDAQSNYAAQIVSRTPTRHYLFSKLIAAFVSGGSVTLFPLVLSLLLTALFIPMVAPDATAGTFPIFSEDLFADAFYTFPFLYILFFLLLDFLIGGLVACAGLVSSYFLSNRFAIVLLPFVLNVSMLLFSGETGLAAYAPSNLLAPFQPYVINPFVLLTLIVVAVAIQLGSTALKARKQECLK